MASPDEGPNGMGSFVRWAGSKRLLIPYLGRLYPKAEAPRYVEPFAGSAALFFALSPRRALLSDINRELIEAYRAVQRDVELVIQCFRRLRRGRAAYYRIRADEGGDESPSVKAARFLYLNRYCFNGLYRTNTAGKFNVPYGPPRRPLVEFEQRLRAGAAVLRSANLVSADFEEVISRVRRGDFVYMDPPYALDERRVFREYLPGSFSTVDIPRLSAALQFLDEVGATFVLSYEMGQESRALVGRWYHRTVITRRNVAGFAGHRRSASEVIISNRPVHG